VSFATFFFFVGAAPRGGSGRVLLFLMIEWSIILYYNSFVDLHDYFLTKSQVSSLLIFSRTSPKC